MRRRGPGRREIKRRGPAEKSEAAAPRTGIVRFVRFLFRCNAPLVLNTFQLPPPSPPPPPPPPRETKALQPLSRAPLHVLLRDCCENGEIT